MHPTLTDYPGWVVYGNENAAKGAVIAHAWHTDVAVLAFLCDAAPGCVGFNSRGKLVSNATALAPAPGVTMFVKNGAPQPSVVDRRAQAGQQKAQMPAEGKKPLPPPPKSPARRAAARHAARK
jgi:hypothetical protein